MTTARPKTHCHYCGGRLIRKHVDGRRRLFCETCREPLYENPVPASAVVLVDTTGRLLLVRRSVEPKVGHWCLPGGFMELGESPEVAALRELQEETGVEGRIEQLLGVVGSPSPRYHSVLMVGYHASRVDGQLAPGDDADEAAFWPMASLPPIAFGSHARFIESYCRLKRIALPDITVVK